MSLATAQEIRVSVDVGCHRHSVAIGLSTGQLLDEFDILHKPSGFEDFFKRIEHWEGAYQAPVRIAMEGYNGYARPLDRLIRLRHYRLYNINNLKLARFKEIFPGAAKTDPIDARKGLELFQLSEQLPTAKGVLQEVVPIPQENDHLKRLTRRRRRLVNERVSIMNSLQSDLQAVCPGLLEITHDVGNVWFIGFLCSCQTLRKLARKRRSSLLKIRGIGQKYADMIKQWQQCAFFSDEVEIVSPMIYEDATRIQELNEKIKQLETQIESLNEQSEIASLLRTIKGFGIITAAEMAGEIGTIDRFEDERSLALYLGMAPLDNSSGSHKRSKTPRQVNTRAKAAMMAAVDRHRKFIPESERYYEKKRAAGKKHNQAVRALGRHLCRVIHKMLRNKVAYVAKVN